MLDRYEIYFFVYLSLKNYPNEKKLSFTFLIPKYHQFLL